MKTLKLITVGVLFIITTTIHAQVSVNVNIGLPPPWGPVGYSEVEYYYLPDLQVYYDIRATQFIYLNNGVWIRTHNLPYKYRNYDLYNGYKVVLTDYHGTKPYTYYHDHKVKYHKGYNKGHQKTIKMKSDHHNDHHNNHHNNGNH
ncbi:hypothetical protein [Flavobacterium aestivum]|uniref:hypothetical protein n=1 Tax=Flavobacterium aestivum TaxID=3003257 RepID=UPI0024828C66|nr:hypothetical protein [Flavobacterium aestivum]